MKGIIRGGLDHSCHLFDPKADLFAGKAKTRHCYGYLGMLKRTGVHALGTQATRDIISGKLNWGRVSTKEVFHSLREFSEFHAGKAGLDLTQIGKGTP